MYFNIQVFHDAGVIQKLSKALRVWCINSNTIDSSNQRGGTESDFTSIFKFKEMKNNGFYINPIFLHVNKTQ